MFSKLRGLIVIFLLISCSDEKLNNICPIECYNGPIETKNVGVCKSGITSCNEENIPTQECIGEFLPYPIEVCDGLDNNCDGLIDNNFKHDSLICKRRGVCSGSKITCINGELSCGYPDSYEEQETKCDMLDNDCDGLTDESLFEESVDRFCYDGPVGTELHAPCHAGRLECKFGQIVCTNQVRPALEVCDYVDNDCNGLVDENITVNGKYDIVIGVDDSESMTSELAAIKYSLLEYISQFDEDPNIRFAVISFANSNGEVKLNRNFVNMGIAMEYIPWSTGRGGEEGNYDAIYEVCDIDNNRLGLNWNPSAKRVYIGFTDEEAQSYSETYNSNIESIISKCKNASISVYHWSEFEDRYQFKPICDETNGEWFSVSDSQDDIAENLESIIIKLCED